MDNISESSSSTNNDYNIPLSNKSSTCKTTQTDVERHVYVYPNYPYMETENKGNMYVNNDVTELWNSMYFPMYHPVMPNPLMQLALCQLHSVQSMYHMSIPWYPYPSFGPYMPLNMPHMMQLPMLMAPRTMVSPSVSCHNSLVPTTDTFGNKNNPSQHLLTSMNDSKLKNNVEKVQISTSKSFPVSVNKKYNYYKLIDEEFSRNKILKKFEQKCLLKTKKLEKSLKNTFNSNTLVTTNTLIDRLNKTHNVRSPNTFSNNSPIWSSRQTRLSTNVNNSNHRAKESPSGSPTPSKIDTKCSVKVDEEKTVVKRYVNKSLSKPTKETSNENNSIKEYEIDVERLSQSLTEAQVNVTNGINNLANVLSTFTETQNNLKNGEYYNDIIRKTIDDALRENETIMKIQTEKQETIRTLSSSNPASIEKLCLAPTPSSSFINDHENLTKYQSPNLLEHDDKRDIEKSKFKNVPTNVLQGSYETDNSKCDEPENLSRDSLLNLHDYNKKISGNTNELNNVRVNTVHEFYNENNHNYGNNNENLSRFSSSDILSYRSSNESNNVQDFSNKNSLTNVQEFYDKNRQRGSEPIFNDNFSKSNNIFHNINDSSVNNNDIINNKYSNINNDNTTNLCEKHLFRNVSYRANNFENSLHCDNQCTVTNNISLKNNNKNFICEKNLFRNNVCETNNFEDNIKPVDSVKSNDSSIKVKNSRSNLSLQSSNNNSITSLSAQNSCGSLKRENINTNLSNTSINYNYTNNVDIVPVSNKLKNSVTNEQKYDIQQELLKITEIIMNEQVLNNNNNNSNINSNNNSNNQTKSQFENITAHFILPNSGKNKTVDSNNNCNNGTDIDTKSEDKNFTKISFSVNYDPKNPENIIVDCAQDGQNINDATFNINSGSCMCTNSYNDIQSTDGDDHNCSNCHDDDIVNNNNNNCWEDCTDCIRNQSSTKRRTRFSQHSVLNNVETLSIISEEDEDSCTNTTCKSLSDSSNPESIVDVCKVSSDYQNVNSTGSYHDVENIEYSVKGVNL